MTPKMIEGRGGVFEVKLGDELLFSKHEQGRFPDHEEIVAAVKAKQSPKAE